MSRIIFPEWRAENSNTTYPFTAEATLTNGTVFIPSGILVDAILYPIGSDGPLRLSRVDVAYGSVTLWIGDSININLASGTFTIPSTNEQIALTDSNGMPAGLLIGQPEQLGLFLTWGIGTQLFESDQTPFTATVCVPTAAPGVTGFLLPDGTLLTGEVWLVGDAGIVLRHEIVTTPDPTGGINGDVTYDVIRVDVVGDPLFRRRLCVPDTLFQTPLMLQTLTIADTEQSVVTYPDKFWKHKHHGEQCPGLGHGAAYTAHRQWQPVRDRRLGNKLKFGFWIEGNAMAKSGFYNQNMHRAFPFQLGTVANAAARALELLKQCRTT